MPADGQERRYVPGDSGKTRDVAPFAYSNKLVRPGETAEPGTVIDFAVTAYLHEIAHNNLVSKSAVVPNVGAYHNEIIITNCSLGAFMHTGMDCYLLVNDVSIAHHKPADFVIYA